MLFVRLKLLQFVSVFIFTPSIKMIKTSNVSP